MSENYIIPRVPGHDRELSLEFGIGSSNSKEYCKCSDCKEMRRRRDSIYFQNSKFKKFFKTLFA